MPRVTRKGQVTIPQQIRLLMRIKSGDEIVFEVEQAKVILSKKKASVDNLKKYVGFLSHLQGKKSDEIVDALRGDVHDYSD